MQMAQPVLHPTFPVQASRYVTAASCRASPSAFMVQLLPLSTGSRCLFVFAVLTLLLAVPNAAGAQAHSREFDNDMHRAFEVRLRTQTVLALAASNTTDAPRLLCPALSDRSATVRSAAAMSLGRLRSTASHLCLVQRLSIESNVSVKAQLDASITRQRSHPTAAAPDATSRWYVAIGKTKNNSDRINEDVDRVVQTTLRARIVAHAGVTLAPNDESPSQAAAIIEHHHLAGYLLQPTVEPLRYAEGMLTVTVRVTMLGYPNRTLQGEFTPTLTQSGTPRRDGPAEIDLIGRAVEIAATKFLSFVDNSKP